jgi:hypothetical protein
MSTRHLLENLVWVDIIKTTINCIKTLKHVLFVLEVLACLVRKSWMSIDVHLPFLDLKLNVVLFCDEQRADIHRMKTQIQTYQ